MSKKGVEYKIRTLNDLEYKHELLKKLDEEVLEFKQDMNLEELADILEVVEFLSQSLNSNLESVLKIKKQKADERGGFKDKIFLEYTR